MIKQKPTRNQRSYQQLERQRKALRNRLYRMIDELDGRPVDRRKYQAFPVGVLEKAIEQSLQGIEDLVRRLVIAVEKRMPKPMNK